MAARKFPSPLDPTLEIYLREIKEVELLTAEQEKELARQVAAGSREAYESLVVANLRFVVFVAKRYRHRGLPLADLVAEGNVGLLEAVVRFDPEAGFRFTTYAYWRIMKCINHALRSRARMVHIPARMVDRMKRWAQAADAFRQKAAREPTPDELGAALKLSSKAMRLVERTVETGIGACQTGACDERLASMAESVPDSLARSPAEEIQHQEQLDVMLTFFERLDPRERKVLTMRFGIGGSEPRTLRAIGAELLVTHEAVRHIQKRALARLHDAMRRRQRNGANATAIPALS